MNSNSFVVTGKFLEAMPKKQLENGKNVSSFFLDVTDNDQYPSTPEFGLYGEKCDLVDNLLKDQYVEVKFNIQGKKYTSKKTGKDAIFTRLQAWDIKLASDPQEQAPNQESPPMAEPNGEGDDLPF